MGTAWIDIALDDMRVRGRPTPYADSYAPNEVRPLGRNAGGSTSNQYRRALLVMGRYADARAFSNTNPDYALEMEWNGEAVLNDYRSRAWNEVLIWNHTYCSEPWGTSHATGWINNTRVVWWDFQLWIKSAATGQWSRLVLADGWSGHPIAPNFWVEDFAGNYRDVRTEASGYDSVRLVYDASAPYASEGSNYWAYHGYAGGVRSFNASDVADVVISAKIALVVHNAGLADDRDYSRFCASIGADYYPTPRIYAYPSVGVSRHKLVRAKWPQYQYVVCHTMTEAQLLAAGGYPPFFGGLAQTYGDGAGSVTPPVPPPTPPTPTPIPTFVAPTLGAWFAKTTGGENTWTTRAATAAAVPAWTTAVLPSVQAGQSVSVQVLASGNPAPTFSKQSGPTYVTVSEAGFVTIAPPASTAATNTTTVIRASNSAGNTDRTFTVGVTAAPTQVEIISAAPPAFTAGTADTWQFIAAGSGTVTWTATGLPAWITVTSGGLMTVNSATAVQARINVTAANATTSDTRSYLVTVAASTAPAAATDNWTRVPRDEQDWTPT